jgi:hypothetical protein
LNSIIMPEQRRMTSKVPDKQRNGRACGANPSVISSGSANAG